MIAHWESEFGARSLAEHAFRSRSSTGDRTPPKPGVSTDAVAVARVSGSVWIADCPTPGCFGAEGVNFSDPVFFCCECRNAAFGHHPIRVKLPSEKTRAGVEAALLARPAPGTRHWTPGGDHFVQIGLIGFHQPETVADLLRENKEHGL